jgi:SPASM domain peptide maturase of grasp-with-spasm system
MLLDSSRLRHINISYPYANISTNDIRNFLLKYRRVHFITFFNSPVDEIIFFDDLDSGLIYSKIESVNHKHCGTIYERDMVSNISLFTESQHHNTCLNRKISIDVEGNIKNCPSMAQSFGNIRDTTLQEALEHPDFKKYWNVKKDQISVCQDCEFRHICTDCRAYLENPEDMYSKPLKCGYNPYTAEWEEWSTHPMKQKAIDYYGMQELVKK